MIESIVLIIFVISFGGVLFILARKIPALNNLPYSSDIGSEGRTVFGDFGNRVKSFFAVFEKQILMHKFLSWVKVMTLKIETKVDHLLHKIRKKAQQIDKDNKDKK